jgi:hypothetical protein
LTSYIYVERGGLLIPERAADADVVRKELKRLDPSLMLTRNWDAKYQQVVWQVRHHVGSGLEPVCVFEWREGGGTGPPLPLSSGLVERFKAQEAKGKELFAAAKAREQKRQHDLDKRLDDDLEEYAKDMARAGDELYSPVFHRGPHLRRARARRRERGLA